MASNRRTPPARAEHADWWKEQTARLGSLEAVHRYIIEELNREQG